jgi:hypothetical protein
LKAARDGHWDTVRAALGEESGSATINIAASNVFSSFLSVSSDDLYHSLSRPVTRERVPIYRLDSLSERFSGFKQDAEPVYAPCRLRPRLRPGCWPARGLPRRTPAHITLIVVRLKSQVLAARHDRESAMNCLTEALAVARAHSALALELRSTMALARLLSENGQRDQARDTLALVYGRFTEGFGTADLGIARTLLQDLGQQF